MKGFYVLYGVEASYYAAKIRACLRHKRVPFTERLADRAAFRDVILPRVGWPVIPVLFTPADETLQDTADMFDTLESRHPAPATLPPEAPGRALCHLLEFLGDEWLKIPALHYRWNHDRAFAIAEFGRNNDPDLPAREQQRIGEKIAARFEGWLGPLGVDAGTIAAVEAEYGALLDGLDAHFEACPFLLGAVPTLADFAFHGPLYAHLYRDPNSGALMRARAPRVAAWVERLRDGDTPHRDAGAIDAVPATLVPVLRRLLRDCVPVLESTAAVLERWLPAQAADEPLPRHAGEHAFVIGRGEAHEAAGTRAVYPFDLFKLQRVLDAADAAPGGREAALPLFAGIGAERVLALAPAARVERRAFRLHRAA